MTLAFGSTGIAIEPATGGPLRTLLAPSHGFACTTEVPAWSLDSAEIAFVRLTGGSGNTQPRTQLAVIDVTTHALRLTPKSLGDVTSYAWSPDGKSLFASLRTGDCGTVWSLDPATLSGTAIYRGCA
jgi:Tol biopolymer transport system component